MKYLLTVGREAKCTEITEHEVDVWFPYVSHEMETGGLSLQNQLLLHMLSEHILFFVDQFKVQVFDVGHRLGT